MRIGRNAFVQGICANIGEGERYFSKSSRARCTRARTLSCAGDRLIHLRDSLSQLRISCSQSRDSCSCRKVVRLFQKWYDFSESGTTFLCISCSHIRERLTRHRDRLIQKKEWLIRRKERLIQRLVGLSRVRAHAPAPREKSFKK